MFDYTDDEYYEPEFDEDETIMDHLFDRYSTDEDDEYEED